MCPTRVTVAVPDTQEPPAPQTQMSVSLAPVYTALHVLTPPAPSTVTALVLGTEETTVTSTSTSAPMESQQSAIPVTMRVSQKAMLHVDTVLSLPPFCSKKRAIAILTFLFSE